MKILFLSDVGSIHAARWINQMDGTGWDYRIFHTATYAHRVRSEFLSGYFYLPSKTDIPNTIQAEYTLWKKTSGPVIRLYKILHKINEFIPFGWEKRYEKLHVRALARLIAEWKPDVIHSLGIFVNWRNNAKVLLEARKVLGGKLPCPWLVSPWGADLDLYPYMGERQRAEAESVFSICDGIISEGDRDLELAQKLGFSGKVYAKLPAFGGVTWTSQNYCRSDIPSKSKIILLKGRDNTDPLSADGDPQGRAMTAMKAFELCQDVLLDYSIVIVQATPAIETQAKILTAVTNLKITVFPNTMSMPYDQWLRLLGSARIMLAITASDGLPGTLVESMSLGVFPIHSGLETVSEWIKDGENGFLVKAEDVGGVEKAIRNAVLNNALVDNAAKINKDLVADKLSDAVIRPQVLELYRSFERHGI